MIKNKIITFLLAISAIYCNAEANSNVTTDKKSESTESKNSLEKLKITADTSDIDYEKGILTFTGDVKVIDPEIEIEADKIVLLFTKKQEIKTFTATGNNKVVVITLHRKGKEDVIAKGEVATYDAELGKVTLTGENTTLIDGASTLTGAKNVTFFMNDKGLSAFNSEGGRTTIDFSRKSALLKKGKK